MSDSKTLVCVIGQVRASKLTWPSFKEYVLDVLGADLAMAVATGPRTEYHEHAKYIWEFDEPVDYAQSFDYVAGALGVKNNWRAVMDVPGWWIGGMPAFIKLHPAGRAASLFFWRWWLWENLSVVADDYDTIIVTRTDFRWKHPHPTGLDHQYVWVPDGEQYGGISDRHIITGRGNIEKVLRCVEALWCEPERVRSEMMATIGNKYIEGIWNFEEAHRFFVERAGLAPLIRHFPTVMFSVRAPDGATSWTQGAWSEEEQCNVKYDWERNLAMGNIADIKSGKPPRGMDAHNRRMYGDALTNANDGK